MRALVLALALGGCMEPLPIHVANWTTDLDMGPVMEAAAALGLEAEITSDSYGAVEIVLVGSQPPGEQIVGQVVTSRWERPCSPKAWAVVDPLVIAHEIGHLLKLRHRNVAGNLMHEWADQGGDDLTGEQQDQIYFSASALVACVP